MVHGERAAAHALASDLQQAGMRSMVPIKGHAFNMLSESVLKATAPEPETTIEENEAVAALNVLSRLIEKLRGDLKSDINTSDIIPLLTSSRTLLEMAGDKAKKRKKSA